MFKSMILVAALIAAGPAFARDNGSWQVGDSQIHLVYSDVDMRTPAGRALMLTRADQAARRLCRQALGVDQKACVAEIVSQATGAHNSHPLAVAIAERGGLASG